MNNPTPATQPAATESPAACFGFLVTLSALHIGTGEGLGDIDKPVLRDAVTRHPRIQPAALKRGLKDLLSSKLESSEHAALFGAEQGGTGMLGPQDGHLLLMPVPCWAGGVAWVTSPGVLKQMRRHAAWCGVDMPKPQGIDPAKSEASIFSDVLAIGLDLDARVVLHDLPLMRKVASPGKDAIAWCKLAKWLVDAAFAKDDDEWRLHVQERLAIVSDVVFDSLVERSLATPARNSIKDGLVENLWREELVPEDVVFYSVITAQPLDQHQRFYATAAEALAVLEPCDLQIGGQASLGRGFLRLNLLRPNAKTQQGHSDAG